MEHITSLLKQLNRKEILPEGALRRNSPWYPLVSYLNNSFALLMGENYYAVSLCIRRSKEFLEHPNMQDFINKEENETYVQLVRHYLQKLWNILLEKKVLSESEIESLELPKKIFNPS